MKVKLRKFSDGDKVYAHELDYSFFGIKLFNYIFKLYYHENYFEMNFGSKKDGITFILSTEGRYYEMFCEENR